MSGRGTTCWETIHTDVASGAKASRPQLDLALRLMRDGHTLVITRLDRLGRSLLHLVALGAQLRGRGIGLHVLEQGIDTGNAEGRAMFGMLAVLAELQRELIVAPCPVSPPRGAASGWVAHGHDRSEVQQARRMVAAGTPLTEVAEVLGVSRTTHYRHLRTIRPLGVTAKPTSPGPTLVAPVVAAPMTGRSSRACPSCGYEPGTREEAVQLRADLAVLWLHPDPKNLGLVVEGRHRRGCHPRSLVVDVECTRCGDGPMLTGALTEDGAPGSVAHPARRWLVAAGWRTAPELVCPEHCWRAIVPAQPG